MTTVLMKRLSLVAVVALGLSGCSGMGTMVDDSDPEAELPNVSMGRAIMEGLGAVPSRSSPINYTPRAPLVVPQNTKALETPKDKNAILGSTDWPVDPDLQRAKMLRDAQARDAGRDPSAPLPSSELLADRLPSSPAARVNSQAQRDPAEPLLPSQLGRDFKPSGIDDTGVYNADGTPRRRALTEPPVTYLEPAPGTPVEIPVDPKKKKKGIFWMFN